MSNKGYSSYKSTKIYIFGKRLYQLLQTTILDCCKKKMKKDEETQKLNTLVSKTLKNLNL